MDTFIETLSDMFFLNEKSIIIFEANGDNCIFNQLAENTFEMSVLENITELFPNINLDEFNSEQSCYLINSDVSYPIKLKFNENSYQWVLEIKSETETNWDNYIKCQTLLNVLFLDLISVKSESDLYKIIVTKAKKILELDRMSIYRYNSNLNTINGVWTSNEKDEIIDFSFFNVDLTTDSLEKDNFSLDEYIVFNELSNLYSNNEKIIKGWFCNVTFFSRNNVSGWIGCDNIKTQKHLPKWKKEILLELGRMIGSFIFNINIEKHLKHEVDKKTIQLNNIVNELRDTKENLKHAEKIASMVI